MCKRLFYRSTFMCSHFYNVFFRRQMHGRHCRGHCPRPEEVFDHAVTMTSPCETCQHSRAWIYIPCRTGGWQWVEAAAWARAGLQQPRYQQQGQPRRRRRRRYRTPSPHPRATQGDQWEDWRNEEEGYWEEELDPPPAYEP
ncbi:hypothetical protein NLG97_g9060 [Lecanicillium saksenae]|uniref:Uncharacterized protein n=1 Tax=Lecanicillium saksenae TaxID=468837 RepID=A0ACC1QIJ4_9HYPO|nr:hypothetical protein NLG97_g9060 [Lecanicillium saksenae]